MARSKVRSYVDGLGDVNGINKFRIRMDNPSCESNAIQFKKEQDLDENAYIAYMAEFKSMNVPAHIKTKRAVLKVRRPLNQTSTLQTGDRLTFGYCSLAITASKLTPYITG